jgi:hypothetical protein
MEVGVGEGGGVDGWGLLHGARKIGGRDWAAA